MSVVYDYQVTDMDGCSVCGVAETPGMWDTLHTAFAFDRSSGTLGTVGGGWVGQVRSSTSCIWGAPLDGTFRRRRYIAFQYERLTGPFQRC